MEKQLEQITGQKKIYVKIGRIVAGGIFLYMLLISVSCALGAISSLFRELEIIDDRHSDLSIKLFLFLFGSFYSALYGIPSVLGLRWLLSKNKKKKDSPEPDSTEKPL